MVKGELHRLFSYWSSALDSTLIFWLFALDGILFENLRDAFIDRLGNYLGIRLQISAGSSLQHIRYRSAKNNPVTFEIPQIDHQRAGRNIPHVHSCATYHSAVGRIDNVVERNILDLRLGTVAAR